MFIANHIYVFNNPAYTKKKKKKNQLKFKNEIKMKKTMFIDIILKKTHIVNSYVCLLQTISMFSTMLHIQQKQPH
jgi:hypothetical protein